jgi:hypothetical protein
MSGQLIHLVGSIPLESSEDVFRAVCGSVAGHICRVPDGETGSRVNWIRVIQDMLFAHPDLERDNDSPLFQFKQWDGKILREFPPMKFKDGVDPNKVRFHTPYEEDAVASFTLFDKLQKEGTIPAGVKFQICIPTPLAPAYNYISVRARDAFIDSFGAHILKVVENIGRRLPKDRIAIQWDVCQEVLMWEGYYAHRAADYKEEIFRVLGMVGDAVPEPIELGYHLCYGSPKDEHLIQPKDTANMVEMVGGIVAAVHRPIQFFHLPVPKERTDADYYRPLSKLKLPKDTELYLGLVHFDDDAGNAKRLAEARKHATFHGVSTECGWGRADPERVPGYLQALRKAAERSA